MEVFNRSIGESDLVIKCKQCEKKFVSERSMMFHSRKMHIKSTKSADSFCNLCHFDYKSNYGLSKHQKKVHRNHSEFLNREILKSELRFECGECDAKFVANDIAIRHQRSHLFSKYNFLKTESFVEELKRYKCKLCHFKFRQFSELARHSNSVHEEDEELLKKSLKEEDFAHSCGKCDLKFVNISSLRFHKLKKHTGVANIEEGKFKLEKKETFCRLCYIKFKKPKALKYHVMKIHSTELEIFSKELTDEDMQFGCSSCSKKFYTQNTLDFHTNRSHNKSKITESICKLCRYDLKSNYSLKIHIKRVHTSDEEIAAFDIKLEPSSLKYNCKYCPQAFLTKNILGRHSIRIHKAEREQQELQCEYCKKEFRWKSSGRSRLREHMKSVHQVNSYEVSEFGTEKKENVTVKSFMSLLNKIKKK